MLRSSLVVGAACAVGSLGCVASAAPLASDDFSYPNGDITTASGGVWVSHSAGSGINDIVDGAYFIDDANSGDVNIGFSTVNSGLLYAGFDLTVDTADEPTGTGSDQPFFAHFGDAGPGRTSVSNFLAGVFLLPGSEAGKFKIGIDGNPTNNPVSFAGEFNSGTTYRLIIEVDFENATTKLFVNAASTSDPSVSDTFGGLTSTDAFAFRGFNADDGDKTVDNLVISTSFAEVVPEPASLALLGIGGLCLLPRRHASV